MPKTTTTPKIAPPKLTGRLVSSGFKPKVKFNPSDRLVAVVAGAVSNLDAEVYETPASSDTASRLICVCSKFQKRHWCEHFHHVLMRELDGIDQDKVKHDLPFFVEVPMFKTPYYGVGVLIDDPDDYGLRRCGIRIDDPDAAVNPNTGEPAMTAGFIGFITTGQGRMSIRQLLIEYVPEVLANEAVSCKSPHHFTGPVKVDVGKRDPMQWREVLSVIQSGWCWTCTDSSGVPDV